MEQNKTHNTPLRPCTDAFEKFRREKWSVRYLNSVKDGGENKHKNGKPVGIRYFSVRFLVAVPYGQRGDHFESVPYAKDQVAIGLVRAKNKRRGGRCKIPLDDVSWKIGKINGCPMSDIHS